MLRSLPLALGAAFVTLGCGHAAPASQMPSAQAALDRLHATQECGIGIHASAKIDRFAKTGRVRGDLLMFAAWPARLRMDVIGPLNVGVAATLTSDATRFTLLDMREKRFFFGPARGCNIARLTAVPMPGHVLVSLLRGDAPVLAHDQADASIAWDGAGYYVVMIRGKNGAAQQIAVSPVPGDYTLPWSRQRLRLIDMRVEQQGAVLYHAELGDHHPVPMAPPRVDPDGIDPPLSPSGPLCTAELPHSIHVEVPGRGDDVLFRYENVTWNPPLPEGLFSQAAPAGLPAQSVDCD